MPKPYIYERQIEYWTSREIEGFFQSAGYEVTALPITQLTEKTLPVDFLFLDNETCKLFGLQYKALYRNHEDYWPLTQHQHQALQQFDWMYYGLSDLTDPKSFANALHYLRLVEPDFDYTEKLTKPAMQSAEIPQYTRWAAFFEAVQSCMKGKKVKGKLDIENALLNGDQTIFSREIKEIIVEVFVSSLESRRIVKFSSLISS